MKLLAPIILLVGLTNARKFEKILKLQSKDKISVPCPLESLSNRATNIDADFQNYKITLKNGQKTAIFKCHWPKDEKDITVFKKWRKSIGKKNACGRVDCKADKGKWKTIDPIPFCPSTETGGWSNYYVQCPCANGVGNFAGNCDYESCESCDEFYVLDQESGTCKYSQLAATYEMMAEQYAIANNVQLTRELE